MCCHVGEKVLRRDPLLLIKKSSLCGDSGVHLEICHNDNMLDVQEPMRCKSMRSRGGVKETKLSFLEDQCYGTAQKNKTMTKQHLVNKAYVTSGQATNLIQLSVK